MRELVATAGVGYLFDPVQPASLAEQLRRIRSDYEAGTLNRFEVTAFLADRSEAAYVRGLWQIYTGHATARRAA
jgi:hypothetical protein